ncbi:cyclic nucleotide-gated ion channel 1-like isoform X1 [Humulus lupulus]|uniref:cyclic nucleotide-gated ion channel 1-like isoform X1 n=1 Tax=Humulus lupulus TaxID=3486 RepID=UPI002B404969|nr:cyclic nucleotide-gated ion channel 1-like isoform X1 [Humulus lupulus]
MNNLEGKDLVALRNHYSKQYNNSNNSEDYHDHGRQEHSLNQILNPGVTDSRLWNKIFLASCVIGVCVDPLFLYIPIVNDDRKCLDRDHNMKIISLVLRSVTDFSYVLHLIFRLQWARTMSKALGQSIFTKFPWSYLLIDLLAIIPTPQITGSRSLRARKFINLLLLLQYVPRILRVYLSAKALGRVFDSLTQRVWVRGAFFFFLYIIFGHVFGAFWYFYSIFRETACWHLACMEHGPKECIPGPFDCLGPHPRMNVTKLNQFCPVDPPNADIFKFGIFSEAIESRIVSKTDFPEKFFRSFWWGLRNLSSFGQNLDTTSNVQENMFAITISTLGLLLFLYLIGNLQTYMQLETTKSEEARRKLSIKQPEIDSFLSNHDLPLYKKKAIKRYLTRTIREDKDFDVKHLFSLLGEHDHHHIETFAAWVTKILDLKKNVNSTSEKKADLWLSKNDIPQDLKRIIKKYIQMRLQDGKDVDIDHILHILPLSQGMLIKKHMCFPMLKKVPLFQNTDEHVYETICKYLKPVTYSEKSYIIRKGEPLDMILFITQGVVWAFGNDTTPMSRLQKGDFYGNELIEWQLKSTSIDEFPISVANLKSHTNVEALALMANDLEHVVSNCWFKFSRTCSSMPESLKPFAVRFLQQLTLRQVRRRRKKVKGSQSGEVSVKML